MSRPSDPGSAKPLRRAEQRPRGGAPEGSGSGSAAKWTTVRTDGASRGNPGPAACGVVIEREGAVLFEGGKPLGRTTNNVAEYEALLYGLELARSLGAEAVDVRVDSELLARQIAGAYKVRRPHLKGLHARALAALRAFKAWRVRHVRREENSAADRAANEALDEAPEGLASGADG